jgi:hypothetical protein
VIRVALTSLLAGYSHERFDSIPIDNVALNDLRWDGTSWRAESVNRKLVPDEGVADTFW